MATVGAFEAKTHFAQLLDRVAKGERILITRHGVPAAELVPAAEAQPSRKMTHAEIVEGFRRLRASIKPDPTMSIRDMINEGRRF